MSAKNRPVMQWRSKVNKAVNLSCWEMEGRPGMYSFQLAKSFYSKEKKQWVPYFKWWIQDLAVLLILVPQAIMWLDDKLKQIKYTPPVEGKILAEAYAEKEPSFDDVNENDLTPSPDEEDNSPNI